MEEKIPKIIHYVWVGGKEKPKSVVEYIETWKKFCPDYEIIEWNETNFDCNSVDFVKEALECKKYAFASDYIRLYALYNYGGIYLDTDCEIIKPLDDLLGNDGFIGFEDNVCLNMATIGAQKGSPFVKMCMDYYKDRHFINKKKMCVIPNPQIASALASVNYNLKTDNSLQVLDCGMTVFPKDYFTPQNYMTGKTTLTENSHVIHHYSFSWSGVKGVKIINKIATFLLKTFGLFNVVTTSVSKKHVKKLIKKLKKEQQKNNEIVFLEEKRANNF